MTEPLFPFTVRGGALYTPKGYPVVCDGCGAHLRAPLDEPAQAHPVRRPEVWDGAGLYHLVCPPLPDGSNPCLVLAELAESLDTPGGPDCSCGACRIAYHHHRPHLAGE